MKKIKVVFAAFGVLDIKWIMNRNMLNSCWTMMLSFVHFNWPAVINKLWCKVEKITAHVHRQVASGNHSGSMLKNVRKGLKSIDWCIMHLFRHAVKQVDDRKLRLSTQISYFLMRSLNFTVIVEVSLVSVGTKYSFILSLRHHVNMHLVLIFNGGKQIWTLFWLTERRRESFG